MSRFTPSKKKIAESIVDALSIHNEVMPDEPTCLIAFAKGPYIFISKEFITDHKLEKYVKMRKYIDRTDGKFEHENGLTVTHAHMVRSIMLTDLQITELKSLKLQLI